MKQDGPNGPMVLVEGLDLAGKSTLVRGLIQHFESTGYTVRYSRNSTVPDNQVALKADALRMRKSASRLETGALFLAAHLNDALLFEAPPVGVVHLQDSSWLRTLAYHSLRDTPIIPQLVYQAKDYQPDFDVVVYLTATMKARESRLLQRMAESPEENDHNDALVVRDPNKAQANDEVLMAVTKDCYPQTVVIDTSCMSPREVLDRAISIIEARI